MAKHIAFGQAVNDAERWAFDLLRQQLPEGYLVLTNLELTTRCGQLMEIDALVVGGWGIYVVDVKGYIGSLDASPNTWSLDGRCIDNSLAKVNYIARILASKLKQKIPVGVYAPWCQGIVFITGRKGEDILLHKSEGSLSVYTPQLIVPALTHEWGITAPYKHKVTEKQKTYVLDTIGQVALIEQRNQRIHDFIKQECLFAQQGLEIWKADYSPGEWQASWLLKILISSGFESKTEQTRQEQYLKNEFQMLQALSGCSGVPYCAPLIQDGEQLILPIKMPRGMPFSLYNLKHADPNLLLQLLRRSVTSLQQIHRRGYTVGGWNTNSVFLSEDGDVEFIEINGQPSPEQDIQQYSQCFLPIAEATGLPWVSQWFEELKEGKTHNLDKLRSNLSAVIAEGDIHSTATQMDNETATGQVIHHCYRLQECISRSDNSELWQAYHISGRYRCGLSVYRSISDYWPQLYSLYKSLESIYHPNIERVIEFGRLADNQTVFISRAWIEGSPLSQLSLGQKKDRVKDWFQQLLCALEYLHSMEVFHGAICPDNIICSHGQAVLANFGVGLDIAAQRYGQAWADPVLWAEESDAEKDLYGLVASFVGVMSVEKTEQLLQKERVEALGNYSPEFMDKEFFAICKKVLTFELSLTPGENYLKLFGFDEEPG